MIGNTGKPKHQITKAVFEELKELYLGTQLGEEGIEAKSRFYELESQIKKTDRELSKLDAILFPGINSPDRAIYSACISYRDALDKGIACAMTHHATKHESEAIQSPDAEKSAQLIVDFLAVSSADTQTQEIQRGLRNAGIAIFHAMSGSRDEDDEETLNAEIWAIVMHKFSEYKRISDNRNACTEKSRTLYEAIIEQKNIVMRDITPTKERSSNPQDYFLGAGREHLETNGLLDDYNTFTPIIALLIDQYGFDRVTFELFEEYCKGHPPLPQATGLFQQPQSITANKEEDPENQVLHYSNPYQHSPIHESKYGSSSTGYQQAPPLDDEGHTESEPQYMTEGKPVAPKARSRINALKELFPEVSESSMSKAGMANSAGALIGFALLIASIVAGRTPSVAQTPILSQNPFILTALMPAILGAITLALIVAAIARMRTNKDITLEFSLGHIAQADAMLLHGHGIRNRADDLPPEECNRISQQTSSALLQSIKSTLRRQIQDIGEGTIDIEKAVARPNHDPRIKVLSLIYSDSEYAESAHNSENKLVITLRAGSMAEKKAWLDVIAKCTPPAQSHPESLHHVRRHHYSDTDPSFGGGKTTFPIGHNGPPALIAKTTKVTINTTQNAGDVLIDSVKNALNNCRQALIDASNKSKKEPSSIMSEHSISSPTASEQHRSN